MFDPITLIFYILALVIAITLHEFSHAFVADYLGDPTPRLQGRVTLNPFAHLDPLGTLMLFIVRFGWGKPVQFDPFNLRNPRRDAAIISFAGPVSNLLLAIVTAILLRFVLSGFLSQNLAIPSKLIVYIIQFLGTLMTLNVVLAIFNLIPVHPLDGFKIVGGFLSTKQAQDWYSLEKYGIFFLIILVFPVFGKTAPVSYIINPVIEFIFQFLLPTSNGFV